MIDQTWLDESTLEKVAGVLREMGAGANVVFPSANDIIKDLLNAGILFRERVPAEAEEDSWETSAGEEEKAAEVVTTPSQAAEPVEHRIARAYVNGFADGVEAGERGDFDRRRS